MLSAGTYSAPTLGNFCKSRGQARGRGRISPPRGLGISDLHMGLGCSGQGAEVLFELVGDSLEQDRAGAGGAAEGLVLGGGGQVLGESLEVALEEAEVRDGGAEVGADVALGRVRLESRRLQDQVVHQSSESAERGVHVDAGEVHQERLAESLK